MVHGGNQKLMLNDRSVIQSDVNQNHRFPQQEKELDKSVG